MDPKLLTISGYRGIVGQTFTSEALEKLVIAFSQLLKENLSSISNQRTEEDTTVLVCRDGRPGGKDYLKTASRTLINKGFRVINGEILPTPLALFAVANFKLAGAIIISASHNPIEYNGLKFVGSDGLFISPDDIGKIKKLMA